MGKEFAIADIITSDCYGTEFFRILYKCLRSDNVLPMTMRHLRDAFRYKRLGVLVIGAIEEKLVAYKIGIVTANGAALTMRQEQVVYVFRKDGDVAKMLALLPSVQTTLRKTG